MANTSSEPDEIIELGVTEGLDIDVDSFVTLDRVSDYNSAVVPVLVDDGGETIRVAGSAFNIHALGLWVTARHVIDDAISNRRDAHIRLLWSGLDEIAGAPPPWLSSEEIPAGTYRQGAFLPVTGWTKDEGNGSDLALLRAGMLNHDGTPHKFPVCRLSTRVPTTGTRIRAVGYAASSITADTERASVRKIALACNLSISHGEVLEVYREGRDTFRDLDGKPTGALPTVCFETSARFDGGMSGGPVADRDGTVCGIVARGGAADDRSFASATPFLFPLRLPQDDPLTVYQLAQAGNIAVDGYLSTLAINYDENGKGTISYECENDAPPV